MKRILKFFALCWISIVCFVNCSQDAPELDSGELKEMSNNFHVSLRDALIQADKMFAQIEGGSTRSSRKLASFEMLNSATRTNEDNLDGFYIVNYEDNGGFALLSADSRRTGVYAISSEGSLHISDTIQNKALGYYLNSCLEGLDKGLIDRPVLDSLQHEFNPIENPKTDFERLSEPMLTGFLSRFRQSSPYNAYCPILGNSRCVVGCGPLAVGTIMAYFEWPMQIKEYNFNWTEMKSYQWQSAWSKLFEVLGRYDYLNAHYGISSTGINFDKNVTQTFTKNGYTASSIQAFNTVIVNDMLRSGIPVLVDGKDVSNPSEGHMWVIDGGYMKGEEYKDAGGYSYMGYTSYYHCVWGWGGANNGYFLYNNSLGGKPQDADSYILDNPYKFNKLLICTGYKPIK